MKKNKEELYIEDMFNDMIKIDEKLQLIIKGHLNIEKKLNSIIENILFHPKYINKLNLSFHAKLNIARSFDQNNHSDVIWEILDLFNILRNKHAHNSVSNKKDKIMEKILIQVEKYYKCPRVSESSKKLFKKTTDDSTRITLIIAIIIGFLIGFEKEVAQLQTLIPNNFKNIEKYRNVNVQIN